MKALWILSAVLWLCFTAASVDLLVLGNPSGVNGVVGAGMTAVIVTAVAVMWRKVER